MRLLNLPVKQDPSLESVQGLRCDDALDLGTGGEAEAEKLTDVRTYYALC